MENTELNAHAAPPKLVRRKCCPGGDSAFIEPPDISTSMAYQYRSTPAPILEEIDVEPPLCERTAWHEAGHAVIGHTLGAAISLVTIRAPARVVYCPDAELTPIQTIARAHAGPVGEMAHRRFWMNGWPSDCDEFLHRVQTFQFGGCDRCIMAMNAWRAVGINASIDAARDVMFEGQRLALEIGQRREVQLAIRALATALMKNHTMTGKEAHAVIEKYIKFGELKNAQENKEDS